MSWVLKIFKKCTQLPELNNAHVYDKKSVASFFSINLDRDLGKILQKQICTKSIVSIIWCSNTICCNIKTKTV